MLLEISLGVILFLLGGVCGGFGMAYAFARDKTVVRVKDNEMIVDKEYFDILHRAIPNKVKQEVYKELVRRGKINVEELNAQLAAQEDGDDGDDRQE